MSEHRRHQDTGKGAKPWNAKIQGKEAAREEQTMLNVRRKHGVIHQLTHHIPDRMLSDAPGANYWLPMTNWVCILHIFTQTMEAITDYSTALPREGGKSLWEASPEELAWAAWPWPAGICILMTAAGSVKPQASTKTRNPRQGCLGIPSNKGWNKGKQPQVVPGEIRIESRKNSSWKEL